MMPITISKKVTKGEDLVVISRREYERLTIALKNKTVLDNQLQQALTEVAKKKIIGPFNSVGALKRSLET